MSDIVRMGSKEMRDQIGRRVDAAHFLGEPTIITRNGEPRAVLISYAEWAAQHPPAEIRPTSPPA